MISDNARNNKEVLENMALLFSNIAFDHMLNLKSYFQIEAGT